MKRFNSVILLLLFILGVNSTFAQKSKSQKKEKLKATAIAQYTFPICVYHPCAVELIVRLDQDKENKPSYARVTVEYFPVASLPNRGFPTELTDRARKWKFKAIRDDSQDAPPAWQLLSGAKDEKIPVGEVLPYYFVKSSEYKEIRE